MYDPDVIEEVNLAGQLYRLDNIGENKVSSIAWLMRDYSNYYDITAIPRKFTSESLAYDIMICGFDNMHARKTFFRKWSNHVASCNTDASKCLFIDGRLSAEEFQIFCIRGNDDYNIDKYKKEYLFNDIEAEEDTCSYKQTSYCANMIASLMTNLLINFAHNLCNADYERELPFLTKYNAFTMYLKTES
jgi:molybdopterin/thiamine biosynthesis adenylyltransferase